LTTTHLKEECSMTTMRRFLVVTTLAALVLTSAPSCRNSPAAPSSTPVVPDGYFQLVPTFNAAGNPNAEATGRVFLKDANGNNTAMTVEVLQMMVNLGGPVETRCDNCFEIRAEFCALDNKLVNFAQIYLSEFPGEFKFDMGTVVSNGYPCATMNSTRYGGPGGSPQGVRILPSGKLSFFEVKRRQFDDLINGVQVNPVDGRATLYVGLSERPFGY